LWWWARTIYKNTTIDLLFARQEREEPGPPLRLSQVLHDLPSSSPDAVATDISPHLYFICLLHLANEHNLKLCDRPMLDEIDIYMPPTSPLVK
jgi:condensin complex subunit 2